MSLHTAESVAAPVTYREFVRYIPDNHLEVAIKVLDSVIQFGKKKGFDQISYRISRADPIYFGENDMFCLPVSRIVINQPEQRMGDYDLVAKLEHAKGGSENYIVKGDLTHIPERYLTCPANCDHCDTKRDRNVTWVVRNINTDQYSQIGSSCISDYTLYDDANESIRYFDVLNEMAKLLAKYNSDQYYDSDFLASGSVSFDYSIAHVVETTLGIIKRDNNCYISETKGLELGAPSTGHMVKAQYGKNPYFPDFNRSEYTDEAKRIIDWVRNDELPASLKNSTFGHNLKAILSRDAIGYEKMGLAVAAVAIFRNEESKKQRSIDSLNSMHQGLVGEKITRKLSLQNVHVMDGYYGTQYLNIYNDETGNIYKWKTSSFNLACQPNKGVHYDAAMTVKEHEVYKSALQTSILKVKFPQLDLINKLLDGFDKLERKQLKKLLSQIENPHLEFCSYGKSVSLHALLDSKGFFNQLDRVAEYLLHPNIKLERIQNETHLCEDMTRFSEEYAEDKNFAEVTEILEELGFDVSSIKPEAKSSLGFG